MKAHRILKVPMDAPDDLAQIDAVLKRQQIDPEHLKAVMCMTEGDGNVRGFTSLAFATYFHEQLGWPIAEVPDRIPLMMIGGCSGLVTPYAGLFVEDASLDGPSDDPGLAIGVATTPDIDIETFGTLEMLDIIADTVTAARAEADIEIADVHCVQAKSLWPTGAALAAAAAAGKTVATLSEWDAGVLGRGGSALGVACALGEIDRATLRQEDLLENMDIVSNICSASSGFERTNIAILVLGNSKSSKSPYRIGHGVMRDGIDAEGVYAALASAGIETDRPLAHGPDNPVDHVFVKTAVERTGSCRGRRHALLTDYLGPYAWLIAKSVSHATVASIVGDPMMQVSGGGEHQGPPGGGLVAVVARK